MSVLTNNYDLAILSLLNTNDDYGYNIVETLNDNFEETIKEISIYTVFKRLEKNKYITSYEGTVQNGGKRKYYKITDVGTKYLNELKYNYELQTKDFNKFLKNIKGEKNE